MTYRWTHPTPRIRSDGTRIDGGDVFEPTAHEYRCWTDRMELVETCSVELSSGDRAGETCGRERPCPYHVDSEVE